MTDNYRPWATGQSTKPDVDALLKAFPPESLEIGAEISDEQVRGVLGRCDGHRYVTVTMAWRKRLLREHRVNLFRRSVTGFYVASPQQVFDKTGGVIAHIGREAGKQTRRLAAVKPVSETERNVQEHQGRLMHVIRSDAKKARMNILPSAQVAEMPRIAPPKS